MKKLSNQKHNDRLFRQEFQRGFRRQHTAGISQGAYAMCKVIHDRAVDSRMTVDSRLSWITSFCETMISNHNKEVQPDAGQSHES